jgi:subtilisin family serine protease
MAAMNLVTQFTVLIERRRLRKALALVTASIMFFSGPFGLPLAHAAPAPASKIAKDLQTVLDATTTPTLNWAKDVNGVRHVKVLIISNSSDPDLVSLRSDVIARGGSVYMRYVSVTALSAMLPANQVAAIAARSDVQGVSPNRMTARTASTLEYSVGALTPAVRTYNSRTAYTGLDGSGVGIAVLDSGLMPTHMHFLNAAGLSRYIRGVDLQRFGDATLTGTRDWAKGVDASAGMYPGSTTMANYESKIAIDITKVNTDQYGHGTHVAAVAAGNSSANTVDSNGIAPNANLYDVRVLDAKGVGQLSDVLAGIDWVIYHAKEYNIRVMNLSLAADSTETWQTDPLARAARSAVAAGVTVVVAAGNFGQASTGTERFGTVSSPGHDPSVITVGSANTKGTAARSDDTVNFFSSRGPTRGSYVDVNGVTQKDNLLKPDLVAPGNKIIAAMGTANNTSYATAVSKSYLPATYTVLKQFTGYDNALYKTQMMLSGTSVAAPSVTGAIALMLQANPGLTPPLIKAILQYSAQPIAGTNLLQQGAGMLNVDGAVRLAQALRTDVNTAVEAGTIAPGARGRQDHAHCELDRQRPDLQLEPHRLRRR